MSEEQWTEIAAIVGAVSMALALILFFLMITLFFSKTAEVERRIATHGKQLDGIRLVWGNGPIGRWMRVIHVYAFFVFRNLPRIGRRIEARMGDEHEPLPLALKLWVLVPYTVFLILAFLFFLSGWYLGTFD